MQDLQQRDRIELPANDNSPFLCSATNTRPLLATRFTLDFAGVHCGRGDLGPSCDLIERGIKATDEVGNSLEIFAWMGCVLCCAGIWLIFPASGLR
jgi:hypothetical protein